MEWATELNNLVARFLVERVAKGDMDPGVAEGIALEMINVCQIYGWRTWTDTADEYRNIDFMVNAFERSERWQRTSAKWRVDWLAYQARRNVLKEYAEASAAVDTESGTAALGEGTEADTGT